MNNKVFLATIHWIKISNDDKNSNIPMFQSTYCPIVAIDGKINEFGSTWSVRCYSFEKKTESDTLSYIKYLNIDDAPDNIKIGSRLELFEGNKKVAIGEIIDEIKGNIDIL